MDPATPRATYAVDDPAIDQVRDLDSGDERPAADTIGSDYDRALQLRMQIAEGIARGEPLYACPLCGVAVRMVCMSDRRRFFFRHEIEDGRCPARTKGELSEEEINARKYNGAKESRAHLRMKQIIAESLRRDPGFTDVQVEPIVKGEGAHRRERRRPDVRAVHEGELPVAFEIQLSTTYLRVIAERRTFYLQNGGLLFWIFKTFDADRARLTQEDVFYNNNRNLFLASEETLAASREAGRLMLQCHWHEPYLADGQIRTRWNGRLVGFDELTKDRERQRVYLFDYDAAMAAARETLEANQVAAAAAEREAAAARQADQDAQLRQAFEDFWLPFDINEDYDIDAWKALRLKFEQFGFFLPSYPAKPGFGPLLNGLYSAREGRAIGWPKLAQLVRVAHTMAHSYPRHMRLFRHALRVYDRAAQVLQEDETGNWQKKATAYKAAMKAREPAYDHDFQYDQLVELLFPELHWQAKRIQANVPLHYPPAQESFDDDEEDTWEED